MDIEILPILTSPMFQKKCKGSTQWVLNGMDIEIFQCFRKNARAPPVGSNGTDMEIFPIF